MPGTTVQADGPKIAELRKELAWSQQKLAVAAGLHGQTIWQVENREDRGTEVGTLWLLAKVFTEQLGRPVAIEDLIVPESEEASAASA